MPKAASHQGILSVSFGEVFEVWRENFLLFEFSNKLAKADAQFSPPRVSDVPEEDIRNMKVSDDLRP